MPQPSRLYIAGTPVGSVLATAEGTEQPEGVVARDARLLILDFEWEEKVKSEKLKVET